MGSMLREKPFRATNGYLALVITIILFGVSIWQLVMWAQEGIAFGIVAWSFIALLTALAWVGFFTVQPNEAKAITLFGDYRGSVRQSGFWWASPFMRKRRVSLRARNFETA